MTHFGLGGKSHNSDTTPPPAHGGCNPFMAEVITLSNGSNPVPEAPAVYFKQNSNLSTALESNDIEKQLSKSKPDMLPLATAHPGVGKNRSLLV